MSRFASNLLYAGLMAFALAAAHLLNFSGPLTTLDEQWASAQDLQAAMDAAAKQSAFERHARQFCGNAAWVEQGDGSITCQPRRGIKGPGAVVVAGGKP
jgi:hypothetical protein